MKPKISVIGAGQVGGTAAHILLQKNLGDIILLDIVSGIPQGKALDLMQGGVIEGYNTKIKGASDYKEIVDSNIVLITAGFPRKPGMDRLDLLKKNAEIVKGIIENIKIYCPNCIIIIMTNPVDVITYYARKILGFNPNRIMGQAGVLDTARFRYFISQELNIPYDSVKTIVLGGHGDTMVPLPRLTTVNGKPISEFLSKERIEELVKSTRSGGAEIVNLFKTGSAYYAPAASAVAMIEAIINDKKEIMPVSSYLNGEYGISDVYMGVPVVLGKGGVEKIVKLELNEDEISLLKKSAGVYKESLKELRDLM